MASAPQRILTELQQAVSSEKDRDKDLREFQQLTEDPKHALLHRFEHNWHRIHSVTNATMRKTSAVQQLVDHLQAFCERAQRNVSQFTAEVARLEPVTLTLLQCPVQVQALHMELGDLEQLLEGIQAEALRRHELQFKLQQLTELKAHIDAHRDKTKFYESYLKSEYESGRVPPAEGQVALQKALEKDLQAYRKEGVTPSGQSAPPPDPAALAEFRPSVDVGNLDDFLGSETGSQLDPQSPAMSPKAAGPADGRPDVLGYLEELDSEALNQPPLPSPVSLGIALPLSLPQGDVALGELEESEPSSGVPNAESNFHEPGQANVADGEVEE
eukprot:TRINITY_DN66847_c0_g1_i1.p1 TRINITY_DN66847_c0_g1~~TRINITY_DN66847_c0_g1_i1.p1  ORF type:complete len:338 (+),score=77.49 TRINITY_DN66847_c0_g1_i1:29-1015(+)